MKLKFIILFFIGSLSVFTQAQELQENKTKKDKIPHKGSIYFTPLPVLSSSPSFGFMYGAAAATSAFLGEPSTTNISTMQTALTFTTMNQMLITNKATVYFKDNGYKLDTDWRYLDSNQATYGLGSGSFSKKLASNGFELSNEGAFSTPVDEKDLLEFKWIRLHQTFSKQIKKGLYLGGGYHLDILDDFKDGLLDLENNPPAITSFYAYNDKYGFSQDKSTLSGISVDGIYDTRDNMNAPYSGRFAKVSFNINPEFLGSDKNSTSLWAEYRDYFDLTKNHRNMLAFWFYGNFQTSGDLPYMNLPAVNYDQYSASGRGYTQGRIRGQHLLYTELEYRKKLIGTKKNPDFFGINLFMNFTTASNKDANIDLLEYIDPAGGIGFRFQVNPKSRTAISLDYAIGKYESSGVYLAINEFF